MREAWLSYMRSILWRYPKNSTKENEAIRAALNESDSGTVHLIEELFFLKRKGNEESRETVDEFLRLIAKKMNLV